MADFIKSAARRLKDAEELMENPTVDSNRSDAICRHNRGAKYLAGYAVECTLKAYLIDQEECQSLRTAQLRINERRRNRGQEPIEQIASSAAGHNIYYLVGLTDIAERPGYDRVLWSRLSGWKSTWRYLHDTPKREHAEGFLRDVRAAVKWLQPKILST